jgi:ABC-type branched-subunit amino acid transport system substrate-binding protein
MGSWTARPRRGLTVRLAAVLLAIVASAMVLAACGGDDNDSGGSGAAASGTSSSGGAADTATPAKGPKLTGEPIKTMTIASVNYNGPTYPNILETAKLYAEWINEHGGIAGRPLEVTACDEQGDPNQLATCGRKAVSDGAIAVVGSYTLNGDRIVPILEDADTSWFGICCGVSPAEINSPVTFNFGSGIASTAAYAMKAADMGCKKPAMLVADVPTKNLAFQAWERVLESRGIHDYVRVPIPVASADYAPQVAQATGHGVDCIIGGIAENQWASFLPPFAQSGSKANIIGPQGNLNEKVGKNFAQYIDGSIVVGIYPDISVPAYKDFRDALAQFKPDPSLDYNSLAGLGTWAAYAGFKEVAEAVKGPITPKSFLDQASKTTDLDLHGMLPKLDLTKPYSLLGYDRLFNSSVTYAVFRGGKLTVEEPGFFDMRKAANIAGGVN